MPVEKLSTWVERRPDFKQCDLLSIDVEGHELSVLRGMDWVKHPKPARCLVIETQSRDGTELWLHRDFTAIEQLLAGCHYCKIASNRNNTFWLHHEELNAPRIEAAKMKLPNYTWYHYDGSSAL